MYKLPTALLAAFVALPAFSATPITLDQAMAAPDWIGNPVESNWWGWDSRTVYYKQKRAGSSLRDTFVIENGKARQLADRELGGIDSTQVVYNRERTRALELRNGDLFERDLRTGALIQIVRGTAPQAAAQYSADGKQVQYRIGQDWFGWDRATHLTAPLALPRAAKDPATPPEADAMREHQLRLSAVLQRMKDEREAARARAEAERKADPTRAPAPVYLGDQVVIEATSLSPDAKWLLVVTSAKGADKGRTGKLPRFVTESGYEEVEDVRARVGRNAPVAHALKLVELATGAVRDLAVDTLPGIQDDPLAAQRKAAKLDPLKGNREVRVEDEGNQVAWTRDGRKAAVLLRAVDNKDRWIATVDLAAAKLVPAHRMTDPAWINWVYGEFGWLPDDATLWFTSEESGYNHLYTLGADGKARALTSGAWEATGVRWSGDGARAWFVCNRKAPIVYEVCELDARAAAVKEVTALEGVEGFTPSPDERKLLVQYSSAYLPPQIAVVGSGGGPVTKLTDTRTEAYRQRSWIVPQFVKIPSSHGAGDIHGKLYRPAQLEAGKRYPVVMFVHGAGYLQNASKRYTYYFREQMFHNLLVQNGYLVLDLDYRASQGYGRAWRTAIYRQMGHPELEDYIDGVNWMVAKQQGDAKHVGVYGGSYGGFMTLMALFRAPETFVSGAALRPVTDWTTYEHEYTSAILNTPALDPDAFLASSPIEYADRLRGHLLIAHGMVDDNVFYQDSVRLAQRLIELKKDHWELAGYPLERHGFVQPESWYDEYRRIFQLFERTLK